MNIFRKLRWQLTLSYTIVTVSTLLVITLILGGIVFTRVFATEISLNPVQLIDDFMKPNNPYSAYEMWCQVLSQSPVNLGLVDRLLSDVRSIISDEELLRIGSIRFSASTTALIRVLVFDPEGVLLGSSTPLDPAFRFQIGDPFDPAQIAGLEGPLRASLAGSRDPKRLYTMLERNQRYVFAAPLFNRAGGDPDQVVGVFVVLFDAIPTRKDIPWHLLRVAGVSLGIFILATGLIGALVGSLFARRLSARFRRISTTTDLWSAGDFSTYIDDSTGDEIAQLTQRLNNMARQLQSLLHRRQDMAISEERNRLARDLHDSAKQQALAASLELGAALTLYERDPGGARKHLAEADALVDSVRKELTNLVDELRPQTLDGEDFSGILREQGVEWSQRSGIELKMNIEGESELPLYTRETLFRIMQEALANIARHSSASCADIFLDCAADTVTLTVKDDGCGFDPDAPHAGIGLASMRERAEAAGGKFMIESAPGKGTLITVSLPVAK